MTHRERLGRSFSAALLARIVLRLLALEGPIPALRPVRVRAGRR